MKLEDYYTAKEAAAVMSIEYKTFLMRVSRGKIKVARIGPMIFVEKTVIHSLLDDQDNGEPPIRDHPLYGLYRGMISRCENPKANAYHRYGGRGIKVCKRWRDDFKAFVEDVGKRPSKKHSLDRYPNPDGDYEPSNTRWATSKQQRANLSKGLSK